MDPLYRWRDLWDFSVFMLKLIAGIIVGTLAAYFIVAALSRFLDWMW